MKSKNITSFLPVCLLILTTFNSCKYYINHDFRQTYADVNEAIHKDTTDIPFFKIHFINGDVGLLDQWNLNTDRDSIIGQGKLYDFNRKEILEGNLSFNVDDIAIVETNQLEAIKSKDQGRIAALSILTGANILLNIVCISNPKACFGSCPTFYAEGEGNIHSVNAEGFSSSISPSLEKYDLDALQYSTSSREFFLTMKNEAFETHAVNRLSIDAVAKHKNEAVYHDRHGSYYQCEKPYTVNKAIAGTREVAGLLSKIDDLEYFSVTDSTDLSSKEEVLLEFEDIPAGDLGIILNYRQTLLTTFLLYSGISYMGDQVGDYFAKIETDPQIKKRLSNPFKRLGKIELYVWNIKDRTWNFIDELYETGPIAKNLILTPLPKYIHEGGPLKIKIKLTKGLWRLDYVGLTTIGAVVKPITVQPSDVKVLDGEDYTLEEVTFDDEKYLLSFPGNEFQFRFDLPEIDDNQEYELFLTSQGYYLEWIRQDWLRGKNLPKLQKMLLNDAQTWRELAIEFKTMEHEMEGVFWNSKYSKIQ